MSKIAKKITGMTEKEILERDFPSMKSVKDIFGATSRNIRIFAGLMICPDELEQERMKLKNNIPKALK